MAGEKNGDLWAITIRSTGKAECTERCSAEDKPRTSPAICGELLQSNHTGSLPRNLLSHQLIDYKMNGRYIPLIYVRKLSSLQYLLTIK